MHTDGSTYSFGKAVLDGAGIWLVKLYQVNVVLGGQMKKVLVADDHAIVRRGLVQMIDAMPNTRVAAEADNGLQALSLIQESSFDLVVLDISMPGKSGLEVLKEIKAYCPDLPVLILSIHPEEQYAMRVFKAGASGYITKDSASDELIHAILTIMSGKKYITPSLAEKMALSLGEDFAKPLHERLSDREYEVMRLLARGRSVKDISDDLFLSIKTVSTYRTRILEKMNLKSNAELIHYAFKHDLVN